MKEYLELSSVPCDEPCAMVGEADYSTRARLECRAFIGQLERTFPQAIEAGCYFKTRSNPHDFGSYYEVSVVYDDDDEAQAEAAFEIESNLPMEWDNDARNFLAAHGYSTAPAGWGKVSV